MATPSLWDSVWEPLVTFAGIATAAFLAWLTKHVWPRGVPDEAGTSAELVAVLSELIRMQDVIDRLTEGEDGYHDIIADLQHSLDDCLELVGGG